jgi:GGDEF domain-containing protein
VLTAGTFESELEGKLKRAVRSQHSLTLVVIEACRDGARADERTLQDVAQLVGRQVRATDLLTCGNEGSVALVLDGDFERSARVIERVRARIEHEELSAALRIEVGAASYPAHAVDAQSLKREAVARRPRESPDG